MSTNPYVITLDIDWASDAIVDHCAAILAEHEVKATWFVTHDSDAVRGLGKRPDLFERGLHPNFHPGSTQGGNPREVLDSLRSVAPEARSVRTHDLLQSTTLLRLMRGEYGIENDLSLLLPRSGGITPHILHLPEGELRRFPTFWEDDVEMMGPEPAFSLSHPDLGVTGLKIFNFHPVHIALNSRSLDSYQALKAAHDVSTVTLADLDAYRNDSRRGAGTFFRELVAAVAEAPGASQTVAELAAQPAGE